MTIQTRPDGLIFADGAKTGEVESFPDLLRGWGVTLDQTEGIPPMEWFNDLFQRQDKAIKYLLQQGISEWSNSETYPIDAVVKFEGKTWQAIQENTGSQPQQDSVDWVAFVNSYTKAEADNNFVQKFGVIPNETDLNTLQKTGIHYIPGSTAAKSLINCPIALAGYVEVVQIQKAIARQRVTTYTGVSYTRYGHSGSAASVNDADWQAWAQDGAEMIGVPLPWPSANVPEGYVALTGQAIDSVRYPKLASIYGTNMPDLRGVVIRGWDNGRGLDPGRTILSYQEDAMQRILGKFYVRSSTGARSNVFVPADGPFTAVRNSESNSDPLTVTGTATSDTTVLLDTAIGTRTADEIRMKNFSFNIICMAG